MSNHVHAIIQPFIQIISQPLVIAAITLVVYGLALHTRRSHVLAAKTMGWLVIAVGLFVSIFGIPLGLVVGAKAALVGFCKPPSPESLSRVKDVDMKTAWRGVIVGTLGVLIFIAIPVLLVRLGWLEAPMLQQPGQSIQYGFLIPMLLGAGLFFAGVRWVYRGVLTQVWRLVLWGP